MNLTDVYIDAELRRIEHEREFSPRGALRWRMEWTRSRAAPRQPVIARLGDRLVSLGERMQRWSAAPPRRALSK